MDAKTLLERMSTAKMPSGLYVGEAVAECLAAIAHKLSDEEMDNKMVSFGAVLADIFLIPHMGIANWPVHKVE